MSHQYVNLYCRSLSNGSASAPFKIMNKYKKIKSVNRDEHRLVMEEYLGRPLETEEIVHHIDDDKSHNEIENLELCLRSVHTSYHLTGKPSPVKGRRIKCGTATAYSKWGCRCDACREAQKLAMREYRKRKKYCDVA